MRAIIGGGRPGMAETPIRTNAERYGCAYCEDGASQCISYPCRMCGNDEKVFTHKEAYEEMMRVGPREDGRYLDPVSGKWFPKDDAMLKHPNRKQRRRLEAWRRKG